MTDVDSVSDNKDELLFDLLKDLNNDDIDEAPGAPVALKNNDNIAVCVICKTSTDLSVIFTLCKQLNLCAECYATYAASQRAEYEEKVVYQRAANEELEYVPPPFLIQCPSCRTMHEPGQILAGIFKP